MPRGRSGNEHCLLGWDSSKKEKSHVGPNRFILSTCSPGARIPVCLEQFLSCENAAAGCTPLLTHLDFSNALVILTNSSLSDEKELFAVVQSQVSEV